MLEGEAALPARRISVDHQELILGRHILRAVPRNVTSSWPRLNRKDGAIPNMERKVRDRCAESANPAA